VGDSQRAHLAFNSNFRNIRDFRHLFLLLL
jgi:hypothetical protein